MTAAADGDTQAQKPRAIHPLWVRATHWINALAILILVTSGWQIYNASPIFPFLRRIPVEITLGKWLAGALLWHFAAMWLLVLNGLVYMTLGIATGRLRMKLFPLSLKGFFADAAAAATGKLSHADLSHYNMIQKVLYLGVILLGVVVVLSGLAIWKPVQFQELTWAFGGYEFARIVHFAAMAGIVGFVVLHVAAALLVPKSLIAMLRGR
jgi:thiosulfate reductase cytochrome b subunit